MEAIIFASFYIFSFAIFLVGVLKNSWTLSFSGSLLLILFSIVTIVFSGMNFQENTYVLNLTDNTGSDVSTFNVKATGMNDPYTLSFAIIMGIFSCFFMLYSLIYLRNKPPRS